MDIPNYEDYGSLPENIDHPTLKAIVKPFMHLCNSLGA